MDKEPDKILNACSYWPYEEYFDGVCYANSEVGPYKCTREDEEKCPHTFKNRSKEK